VPNDPSNLTFEPVAVEPDLPSARRTDWPMGDQNATHKDKMAAFEAAADAAFADPAIRTKAFIVLHDGKIVAERYDQGVDANTSFHGWSMTKSVMTTYMAVLEHQGHLRIFEETDYDEWADDERNQIRLGDLLRMSSGLKCYRPQDYPKSEWDAMEYPHYLMTWIDATDSVSFSTALPKQFAPGTHGRYKDCDPSLLSGVLREKIEKTDGEYYTWPQRMIFDKIGIRSMGIGVDAAGNFLTGADGFATARDWARLGLLWEQEGVAPDGTRLFGDHFVDFAVMPTPAWTMGSRYGAGFWASLNSMDDPFDLPRSTYWMAGGTEQKVAIIPSHDLVVVRLAFDDLKGGPGRSKALGQAVRLAVDAVEAMEP
ncbi:MAG: serine hydrolase, partial [Pseudomonadota bacterium]